MTNENICWVANEGGTWALPDMWSGGHFIKGRVVATGLAVPAGTTNYKETALSLLKALATWDGAWVADGTWCFTNAGETVAEIIIHAASLTVDACWMCDGAYRGKDGVDVSDMVRATETTDRQGASE